MSGFFERLFFLVLNKGCAYSSPVSLLNQYSCQMAALANLLKSTRISVISSFSGIREKFSARFRRASIALVSFSEE